MNPKTQTWVASIELITQEVISSFIHLSTEEMHIRQSPDTWSIAENLEHLIVVNSSYFPIFERVKDGTFQSAFISRFSYFPNMLGKMIYKSVTDGGKKKVKTFALWEPKILHGDDTILVRFQHHQEELVTRIKEMDPFVTQKIIIHSPVNKLIVYSLEHAFDIIVAHERRHLEQATRLLKENI